MDARQRVKIQDMLDSKTQEAFDRWAGAKERAATIEPPDTQYVWETNAAYKDMRATRDAFRELMKECGI